MQGYVVDNYFTIYDAKVVITQNGVANAKYYTGYENLDGLSENEPIEFPVENLGYIFNLGGTTHFYKSEIKLDDRGYYVDVGLYGDIYSYKMADYEHIKVAPYYALNSETSTLNTEAIETEGSLYLNVVAENGFTIRTNGTNWLDVYKFDGESYQLVEYLPTEEAELDSWLEENNYQLDAGDYVFEYAGGVVNLELQTEISGVSKKFKFFIHDNTAKSLTSFLNHIKDNLLSENEVGIVFSQSGKIYYVTNESFKSVFLVDEIKNPILYQIEQMSETLNTFTNKANSAEEKANSANSSLSSLTNEINNLKTITNNQNQSYTSLSNKIPANLSTTISTLEQNITELKERPTIPQDLQQTISSHEQTISSLEQTISDLQQAFQAFQQNAIQTIKEQLLQEAQTGTINYNTIYTIEEPTIKILAPNGVPVFSGEFVKVADGEYKIDFDTSTYGDGNYTVEIV